MVRFIYVRKLRFNEVGFWFVIVRYFLLLNNYVILGLQKHVFLIKSGIHHFFVRSGDVWKLRHNYLVSWFGNLLYLFLRQNYVINTFLTMTYFSWRSDYVPLWYVSLRMDITFRFHSLLWRIFISSQLHYLFVGWSYDFWYVRMTLCFGRFELCIEMTWKLRLVFVRHRDVSFITLRLRYLICLT